MTDLFLNLLNIWIPIAALVWIVGLIILLAYAGISFLRIQRKVKASIRLQDSTWICDEIKTPFILGIFRPRVYLPSNMDEAQKSHVLAHEKAHLRQKDHWWKPLGFLLLAIHWFNPLCWVAYILLCRDIELACDERVIQTMENKERVAYSEALLRCSLPRRNVAACPLAFGEVGVKKRIKTVLNYKKPAFWVVIIAIVVCVLAAACFLTDPIKELTAEEALSELEASIGWEYTNVSFHLPEDYPVENWNIHIAGRAIYDDGFSQSMHYFEDEEWIADHTYIIDMGNTEYTELTMTVTLPGESGEPIERSFSLLQD